eukprot:g2299.t1
MGWTVSEGVERAGCGCGQFVPFLVCFVATMADSFEMILLAFIGPMVRCEWQCDRFEEAMLTTIVFCGMMIGGFVWGTLADHRHVGRRLCVVWANAITFAAGLASAFAPNIWSLIALRGILGLGISGNTLMPFTLFMEMIPSKNRGLWSTVISWSWSVGAVIVVLLAWAILPSYGWRYLVLAASAPGGACLTISLTLLLESPFFFAMHRNYEGARSVIKKIATANGTSLPSGELVFQNDKKRDRSDSMWDHLAEEEDMIMRRRRSESLIPAVKSGGVASLFTKDIWTTTLRLWFVWFACAFCYYGTIIVTTMLAKEDGTWESEECKETGDNWGNGKTADYVFSGNAYGEILSSTWGELASAVVTSLFLDVIGRKALMTSAFTTFAAMFLILSMMKSQAGIESDDVANSTATEIDDTDENGSSVAFTIIMFFARTSGAIVLTPTIYVYTTEIYTTAQRAAGLSMGYIFARFGGIVSPFVGQALFEMSYVGSLLTFAVVAFIAAIFSASFTQRTTGVPLRGGH